MRKITRLGRNAFLNAKNFKMGNTAVKALQNVTILSLFGKEIAYRYNDHENTLSITSAGWKKQTTKDRLNSLPGVFIQQKNFEWYLNGKKWDGELIDIK